MASPRFLTFIGDAGVINKISNTNTVPGARDFRIMTRQMVNAILSVGECNRFSKGIFNWVGFETKMDRTYKCETCGR